MIEEKVRTHQGTCLTCGNRISPERIENYYNEPFCREECEEFYYKENGLPMSIGFKFVRCSVSVGFALCSRTKKPSMLQYVMLYDKADGPPEDFKPLDRRVFA
jgi:hypothetical protein